MISVMALKPSQDNNHSCHSNFKPVVQRIPQTTALDVSEKQKMQLSHSLAEPRPPGIAFRIRSKIASGPRSLETKWASLKVASAPNTNTNQDISSEWALLPLSFLVHPALFEMPGAYQPSGISSLAEGPSHSPSLCWTLCNPRAPANQSRACKRRLL